MLPNCCILVVAKLLLLQSLLYLSTVQSLRHSMVLEKWSWRSGTQPSARRSRAFKFPTFRNLRNIQTQFKCTSSDELSAVTLKISAINYCLTNCGSTIIPETEEKNFVKMYQNFSKGRLSTEKKIFKKTNDIFKQRNSSNLTSSKRRKQRNLNLKNRRPSP